MRYDDHSSPVSEHKRNMSYNQIVIKKEKM